MTKSTARKPRPKADPVDPTNQTQSPREHHDTDPSADPGNTDRDPRHGAPHFPNPDRYSSVMSVDSQGEVRAGPGDAGMQEAPRVLDDPQDKPRRSGTGLMIALLIGGPVLVVLLWLLLA